MDLQNRLTRGLHTVSAWRREIFKRNRADPEKDQQDEIDMQPLVPLGKVDPTNADLKQLHSAALHGRKKGILEVLQKGIWVDFPNDAGQTALFCAALRGQNGALELLLQNGANPNEKSDTGMTPVHVVCLKASLRALGHMIEAGGDLRLHDNDGNGCIDWARFHPDPRKRMKMMEFLQKTQLFALNYSGDFSGNTLERQPSILQMLRGKVSSQMSLDTGQETGLRRVHSHGYGRVYYGGESASGVISVIPLVTENQLEHDSDGISFDSSSGFTMTAMQWNMTPITLKQENKKQHVHHLVDLLISEVEHFSKLRHPNILLLMGLCQSNNFDKVMLGFERVSIGSLYYILHQKIDHLPMTYIRDICCQVCQALLYIHGQNYIHCSLTSHAVFMVTMHQAKVGNLEYMVEMKKASTGRSCLVASSPHREHVFRWMAPEIMMGNPPTAACDVYSFCCILWEMIASEVPWKSKTEQELYDLHKSNRAVLPSPPKSVPLFQSIIDEGLKKHTSRPKDFIPLLHWLQGPLDKATGWKTNALDRLKTLQKESKERIMLSSRLSSTFEASTSTSTSEELSGVSQSSSSGIETPDSTKLSRNASNTTNNHTATDQQKSGNASSSFSAAHRVDGLDTDTTDGHNTAEDRNECSGGRKRFIVHSAGQIGTRQLPSDSATIARYQFDRSSSFSTVKSLLNYSRRTASLPWQRSHGLLRAGSTSPCFLGRGYHDVDGADSGLERWSKTPVKPASHSTDVKHFIKDNTPGTIQTMDIVPRRTRRLSPRRSLPASQNCHDASSQTFPRSRSASGDVLEISQKDVELSVPGSVRTLTEQFQAQLYNHHLRQSILKGSMTPQGTLFEDLDTSPICLKQTPNLSEVPPEGCKEDDVSSQDKEIQTASSKGSTESLTSVSFRDESSLDEEHAFPVSTRTELDITDDMPLSKPSPVYPPYSAHLHKSAANTDTRIFREKSAFRKFSKENATDTDCTDGCPDACGKLSQKSQFLPSSLPGTDISSHPFDFQDYYIDDDYTAMDNDDPNRLDSQNNRDCEATHITNRSRQRVRNRVWLGDNKKVQKKRINQSEKRGDDYQGENWRIVEQNSAEKHRKKPWGSPKRLAEKPATESHMGEARSNREEFLESQRRREENGKKRGMESVKKKVEGRINQDQRKEENGDGKVQNMMPEDEFIVGRHCTTEETDSDREHSSDRHADFGVINQSDGDDKQVQKTWDTIKQRESRWEEFVRHNPRKSMTRDKGSTKDNAHSSEHAESDDGENPAKNQDCQDERHHHHSLVHQDHIEDLSDVPDYMNNLDHFEKNYDGCLSEEESDHLLLSVSRESSVNTVVENPMQALVPQAISASDDDDNDTTLIPDEVVDHPPRCIVLNLERNTLSQEDFQKDNSPPGALGRAASTAASGVTDEDSCCSGTTSNEAAAAATRPPNARAGTTSSFPPSSPPAAQSTLRKFYLGSSAGSQGYTTTLKVQSSLRNPGHHRITHTARDTGTGVTQTVHEETVQAETLRTTMGIQ